MAFSTSEYTSVSAMERTGKRISTNTTKTSYPLPSARRRSNYSLAPSIRSSMSISAAIVRSIVFVIAKYVLLASLALALVIATLVLLSVHLLNLLLNPLFGSGTLTGRGSNSPPSNSGIKDAHTLGLWKCSINFLTRLSRRLGWS
jgi:hypothetical protein